MNSGDAKAVSCLLDSAHENRYKPSLIVTGLLPFDKLALNPLDTLTPIPFHTLAQSVELSSPCGRGMTGVITRTRGVGRGNCAHLGLLYMRT